MSKDVHYPLHQLVLIKKKRLEEAEKVLAEKRENLAKEEAKYKVLEEARNKVRDHKIAKLTEHRLLMDTGTSSSKVQSSKAYLKIVDEQLETEEKKLEQQQKVVDAAKEEVETARLDVFAKQKAVEKLSIHREEWTKEVKKELNTLEALESDEIGSAMYSLKKIRNKNAS